MKATGIVRRIDDLGRVVIPKEIRRTMRIREGDPLEIYTNSEGEVIFKKYSAINEMAQAASQVADVMTRLANCPTIVFDRDHVVAVAGVQKKEFNERRVSQGLEEFLEHRKNYIYSSINDTKVSTSAELTAQKNLYSAGDEITLTFIRNGEENTVSVVLDEIKSES